MRHLITASVLASLFNAPLGMAESFVLDDFVSLRNLRSPEPAVVCYEVSNDDFFIKNCFFRISQSFHDLYSQRMQTFSEVAFATVGVDENATFCIDYSERIGILRPWERAHSDLRNHFWRASALRDLVPFCSVAPENHGYKYNYSEKSPPLFEISFDRVAAVAAEDSPPPPTPSSSPTLDEVYLSDSDEVPSDENEVPAGAVSGILDYRRERFVSDADIAEVFSDVTNMIGGEQGEF